MKQPALILNNVGKKYRLYDTGYARLVTLLGWADKSHSHWALSNVSFELQPGQCLGVIGDNGAGKSTLLKLLAGTLQPSQGTIQRAGRVTAILELGAGFHPEFTGRENLSFGGGFIGLERHDVVRLMDEIIAFSELGDAIDRQVKTYSSGMVVRLAFALVTAVPPEVLIIDEALAVGDQHFQKKCIHRIEQFRQQGCTILFCSHSLYHVRQLCDRALWLDKGLVRAIAATDQVLAAYETHVRQQNQTGSASLTEVASNPAHQATFHQVDQAGQPGLVLAVAGMPAWMPPLGSTQANLVSVHAETMVSGDPPRLVSPDLVVTITASAAIDTPPSMGLMIELDGGVGITSVGTHADGVVPHQLPNGLWQARVTFPALPLHSGEYVLSVYLFDAAGLLVFEEWRNCIRFLHIFEQSTPGLVRLPHVWS